MKRRNADTGKLRRPMKRTKITEGMYGNSMLYVKFVLLWSSVALADYMLEFRFEFLWPLWLLLKAVYHCYHCKGLAFTVFFTCIALSSDMVCYFFIPTQILTYLAGLYVWMHSIWTTFESKGVCAQTLGMWCLCVYAEALRTGMISAALSGALEPETEDWSTKHWPAHALGFPIVSLGVGVKQLVDEKLRLRTQRRVRAQNEFYFKLMREALPEDGATSTYSSELFGEVDAGLSAGKQKRWKPDTNGHCVHACPLKDKSDRERDTERKDIQAKLEHLEQHLEKKNRTRDSSTQSQKSAQNVPNGIPNHVPNGVHNSIPNSVHSSVHSVPNSVQSSSQPSPHAPHTNGSAKGAGFLDEDKHNHCKGGAKSTKYDKKEATTLKEDKRRKKNRDLDKEIIDSHKNTENTKEQVDKELESTKELFKKECNNINKERDKEREEERRREKEEEKKREEERKREREEEKRREREEDKRREKERERELKEREKERERERDRERELLSARECAEELSKVRAALAAALRSEAETARQLSAERAAERQRRAAHQDLKQQLQQKMSTWRCGEKAALERKLGEERRARLAAEQQLLKVTRAPHGECESEWCKSRRSAADAESATLRKDLQRTRDRLGQLQRDLNLANEQVALLEGEKAACQGGCVQNGAGAIHALQARAAHLECVLSAETRVKLDLLSALGDANRKMHIQDSVIHRQEKELEELKAQMLAVMPTDFVGPSQSSMSKMRLSDASPLDPNASVYTPKQLCSDA